MTTSAPHQHGHGDHALGACRILVVDDEQAMQVLASTILKKLGHHPHAVGSGEEAIEVFRAASQDRRPFSLIIMDLALPGGISGLETTILNKQIDPRVRVIVSSGYLEHNARAAALEYGFAGILPKPYTAERMSSELRFVLKHRESERPDAAQVENHSAPPPGFAG